MKRLLFSLSLILPLMGCAGTAVKDPALYQNMSCDELKVEKEKLQEKLNAKVQNKEMGRAVDTGTTVAAQGASLAGVPYVGGVVSIAKTLFNHNKQSATQNTQQVENAYYTVENMTFEKGCI